MPRILQNHDVLAVHDMRAVARFFVDALDFRIVAEPAGWVFVRKDDCLIMIGECPDDLPASQIGCHSYFAYLKVDDVDACYDRVRRAGAGPADAPVDMPWGMREFGVRTPEGHRIRIGQEIGRSGG
jgi:uncharacterized glyoxalase superfamily protein PhnB